MSNNFSHSTRHGNISNIYLVGEHKYKYDKHFIVTEVTLGGDICHKKYCFEASL